MANPNCRRVAVSVIFFLLCAWSGFVPPLGAASVEDIALMNRADRQKILARGREERRQSLVVYHADRRSGGAAGERRFRERISIHPGRILPRQRRAPRAENARRISSQKIRRRYHRRHGVADHGAARRLLQRFYSPMLAEYPAELKDAQGFWGTTNLYFFATGYNTRMVKPNEVAENLRGPCSIRAGRGR